MKLLILGATGETGSRLLRMAIQEGHEVTAFVRSADKLNAQLTAASLAAPAVITW
jgi:putative NADH-flavin reductase